MGAIIPAVVNPATVAELIENNVRRLIIDERPINPKYFDALFNLGATYYNQGVEKYKECDKIPPREAAKYDGCVADANKIFGKSIGYFETAYGERSTDKDIINALKEARSRKEAR